MSRPFVLFLPTHRAGGTGELVRSLTMARALRRRAPGLRIEFLMPGADDAQRDIGFPMTCHDGPEERKGDFDSQQIARLRPDVAVFISTCRSQTLRACKRLGVRTVCVTHDAGSSRKAFRFDYLWMLDEHWHQRDILTLPAFTRAQSFKSSISTTRRFVYDTLFPEWLPEAEPFEPGIARLAQQPFAIFIPGGGGYHMAGTSAAEVFVDAAERLHAATGIAALTLTGKRFPEAAAKAHATLAVAEVSHAQTIELLRRAAVVVTNGGGCLHEALACRAAVVAVPVGAHDQPARVEHCVSAGLILTADARPAALAEAAARLLRDDPLRAQLRQRAQALKLVNGLPWMTERLLQLTGMSAGAAAG